MTPERLAEIEAAIASSPYGAIPVTEAEVSDQSWMAELRSRYKLISDFYKIYWPLDFWDGPHNGCIS